MQASIYVLKDPITNEIRYVGCTKNVEQRYKAHTNKARDYNTPKREWLESLRTQGLKPILEVIEVVDNNYLEREKYYIQLYRLQNYNLTNTGSIDFNGNQTSFKSGHNSIKVIALLLDGTFYNSYDSISLAAEKNNTTISNISSVLSKTTKTASKLIWIYEDDYYDLTKEDIDDLIFNANDNSLRGNKETQFGEGHIAWNKGLKTKLKPNKNVHQYNASTGEFIKTWDTAKIAAIELNCNAEGIGQCCRGKAKSAGGYIWKYIKTDTIEVLNNIKLGINNSKITTYNIGHLRKN